MFILNGVLSGYPEARKTSFLKNQDYKSANFFSFGLKKSYALPDYFVMKHLEWFGQ